MNVKVNPCTLPHLIVISICWGLELNNEHSASQDTTITKSVFWIKYFYEDKWCFIKVTPFSWWTCQFSLSHYWIMYWNCKENLQLKSILGATNSTWVKESPYCYMHIIFLLTVSFRKKAVMNQSHLKCSL